MCFDCREVSQQLEDINNGISKPSIVQGKIINSVFHHETWKEKFENSTAWLEWFSTLTGTSLSRLWRHKAVYEYYLTLPKTLSEFGITVPDIVNLPKYVTSEHLELLSKLERVAPVDVMKPLYEKTFNGTISRDNLRHQWSIFRTVLDGKTARGRNVTAPKRNTRDARNIAIYLEAMLNKKLADNIDQLVNIFQCDSCLIFREFKVPKIKFVFDAIVVSTFKSQNEIEIHGFELKNFGKISESKMQICSKAKKYCDYLWIVVDEHNFDVDADYQHDKVGILVIDEHSIIKVKKIASKNVDASHAILSDQILLNIL